VTRLDWKWAAVRLLILAVATEVMLELHCRW
jgi:hypothetical protein